MLFGRGAAVGRRDRSLGRGAGRAEGGQRREAEIEQSLADVFEALGSDVADNHLHCKSFPEGASEPTLSWTLLPAVWTRVPSSAPRPGPSGASRAGSAAPAAAARTDNPDATAIAATNPSLKSAGDASLPAPPKPATATAMPSTPPS